jgi:hypothetical protein
VRDTIKIGNIVVRPEITELKYWFHLFLITLIVGLLVNWFIQPMPLDTKFLGLGTLFIGISDIIVHTLLKLD